MAKKGKDNATPDNQSEPAIDEGLREIVETLPASSDFTLRLMEVIPDAQSMKQYLEEIARLPSMEASEEERLAESLRQKDDRKARKKLNEANLRLVVWIAKEYAGADVQLTDLINEGTLGLIAAIDTYQPGEGRAFKLHAASLIRKAISEALAYETTLSRVPGYLLEKITSIKPVSKKLEEKLKREATRAEVAEELGMSEDELDRLVKLIGQKEEEPEDADDEDVPQEEDYYEGTDF